MELLDKTWRQGDGKENEDIGNHAGNFAWVLDGATALATREDNPYTPRWLVETADRILSEGAATCRSLRELFDYYCRNFPITEQLRGLAFEDTPNFAMSIIHQDKSRMEYAFFADCYLAIRQNGAITVLTDDVWAELTGPIADKAFFMKHSREERKKIYHTIRQNGNRTDGYWIGSADGEGFRNTKIYTIDLEDKNTEFILCSDGFERICSLFSDCGWQDIFATKLDKVTDRLRQIEATTGTDAEYGREKRSDDVCALKLRAKSWI